MSTSTTIAKLASPPTDFEAMPASVLYAATCSAPPFARMLRLLVCANPTGLKVNYITYDAFFVIAYGNDMHRSFEEHAAPQRT